MSSRRMKWILHLQYVFLYIAQLVLVLVVIYNQIVTWTAFAILAMFLVGSVRYFRIVTQRLMRRIESVTELLMKRQIGKHDAVGSKQNLELPSSVH